MKKRQVLNLIKYFTEGNETGFRTEAYEIAKSFDKSGDYQLAEYIMALLSDANTFVPQVNEDSYDSLRKVSLLNPDSLPLPDSISKDIIGIVNAVRRNIGVNKFLFEGAPGTGKTEAGRIRKRVSGERSVWRNSIAPSHADAGSPSGRIHGNVYCLRPILFIRDQ